jgi:hypothetical protein
LGNRTKQYQATLDLTSNGLPVAYIDPQVVVEQIAQGDEPTQSEITMATVDIDYLEGFPIVDGRPFWERLDCEPLDYYKLYKGYRDQKNTETSQRSFDKLEQQTNTPVSYLYAISKVYHWQIRVKAYDLFNRQLLEDEREKQIKIMEGSHIKTAEKIRTLCETYLDQLKNTPSLMVNFKPNMFQGLLELSLKMDRLSLGLPSNAPITKEEKESLKVVINQTTNNTNTANQVNLTSEEKVKYLQEIVDVLHQAKALPKTLEAQGDVMEATIIEQGKEENNEKDTS